MQLCGQLFLFCFVIGRRECSDFFLFVFVSVLLRFCMSWKPLKSGNTVNAEYLNRIPNS